MTEYIFRASDPDTAMEKAVRELGDDAMILSVTKMGDVTEVRATRESDVADQLPWDDRKPQSWPTDAMDLGAAMRTARARRNGSDPAPTPRRAADINAAPLREKGADMGVTAAPVARPAEEPETILDATQFEELFRQRLAETPDDKPELVSNAAEPVSRQQDPIARETATARDSSAGQTVSWAPDKADSTDNWVEDSALAAQVPAAKQPSATILNETAVAQHRISIFDFGFPKDIAQSCAVAPDLHTLQAQQDHACHLLAARITDDAEISVVHENKALFLFGPPGAGKTTVAAQLAFERLRSTAFQPRLVQVPQKGFVTCGRLQQYATLLNSEFRTLSFEDDEDFARNDIIDCDLTEPDAIAEALEWVTERSSGSDISPLLIIPSTWSIAAIKQYTMMFEAICPATVLTHMDIGGIDIAGLSAMADANIKLIAANETRKITEGLTLVDRDSVERFLQVTLATSVEDAQQYSTRH
jgi:flagellar biosynthesis GTPase FlhF